MKNGHIYTGEGKGKTTAAFFKRKNTDGEVFTSNILNINTAVFDRIDDSEGIEINLLSSLIIL